MLLQADHGEGNVKVRKQISVLIVDDDPLVRETLEEMLEDHGLEAQTAPGGEEALTAAGSSEFDAVLCDIQMPGKDGVVLLPELRELRPTTPVILMTGYASIDSAVAAMRAGAFDYITKPFKNDAVMASLERAFAYRELEKENQRLRRAVDRTSSFGDLIGTSPAMREIFALIRKISGSSSNVLLTGESGTGKDVVARTIHFTTLCAYQLHGDARGLARERALRSRSRCLHRRACYETGALRGGGRWDAVPRRDRRYAALPPEQDAAGTPGPRDSARGVHANHQGRRAHHRRDEQGPQA